MMSHQKAVKGAKSHQKVPKICQKWSKNGHKNGSKKGCKKP
jgi:hypothetical protein